MTATVAADRSATSEYQSYIDAGGGYVVREQAGLYRHDGADALDLLHRITTNDLHSLQPGKAKRTVIADERGRVVDAPWVVMREPNDLLLITDMREVSAVERAILKYTIIEDACLTGLGDQLKRVTLFGQGIEGVIDGLSSDGDVGACETGDWISVGDVHLLKSTFGEAPCWEVVIPSEHFAATVKLLEDKLPSISEETFHVIRTANGIPWPGYELSVAVNPLESGLRDWVDFDKGCYVGQEVIARLDTYEKVQRSLVKLRLAEDCVLARDSQPARDVALRGEDGRKIGWISSSEVVPTSGEWIGLGFVRTAYAEDATVIGTEDGVMLRVSTP